MPATAPGDGAKTGSLSLELAGLGKLPFTGFHANQAWANLAVLAMNLVSWLQLTALPIGHTPAAGT